MKILRIVLAVVMLAFALVQLNDPDGFRWMLVYGAVGVAIALSARAPSLLVGVPGRLASLALVAGLLVLVILHWPDEAGFWHKEIWWESETAREGMGLGIAFAASLFVLPVAFGGTRRRSSDER